MQENYLNGTKMESQSYSYYNAVVHRQGLGFRGFEKVMVYDQVRGRTSEKTINPLNYGIPVKDVNHFSEVTYSATATVASNKKLTIRVTSLTEKDKATDTSISRSYLYDSYNNVTKETVNYVSGVKTVTDRTYYNSASGSLYLLGQPVTKTVTSTRNGSSWIDKETFAYNAKRQVEQRISYTGTGGSNKTGETRWRYDAHGNIVSEKSVPYNVNEFLGDSIVYDTQGRYVTSVLNSLGQKTTFSDYGKYGNPKTVKDHKNRTTTYNYDQWGHLTSVVHPSGVIDSTAIDWGGAGLYTITTTNGVTPVLTRYYIGGQSELDPPSDTERLYLGENPYSAPAEYVKEGGNWNIYYICRDYLGSITHVANADGSLAYEYSYYAWGRLRNPSTQVAYTPGNEPVLFLGRGYTGHEHLPWFGLINMNARLYDAALGRFLSPDPYVQMPDFSQNFNRYSYCVNNPLIYIDPSGEWFLIDDLVMAVIGGAINLTVNLVQGNVTSFWHGAALFENGFVGGAASLYVSPIVGAAMVNAGNSALNQGFTNGWENIQWDQVGISGITGAATSFLGGQLGNYLSKPISNLTSNIASPVLREVATQTTTNATTGFALSTGFAWGNGASFKEGLKQGGQGALMGAGIGVMTGTATGFKYAHDNKVDPWTGKEVSVNKTNIQFGNNPNQEYHTFRHTDELGLNQIDVRSAVETNLQLHSGVPSDNSIFQKCEKLRYFIRELFKKLFTCKFILFWIFIHLLIIKQSPF